MKTSRIFRSVVLAFVIGLIPLALTGQRHGSSSTDNAITKPAGDAAASGTQQFDIRVGKDNVGFYKVSRNVAGNETRYHAESETVVRFMGQIKITYTLDCVYEDGVLVSSSYESFKNGKPRDKSVITKSGQNYNVVLNGKKKTLNGPITTSTVQLYFDKPQATTTALAEGEAIIKNVTSKGGGMFLVTEQGKSSGTEYIYEGPTLERVNVSFAIMDFSVVRP